MSIQTETVGISDLGLASTLSLMGFRIDRLDRSNPKRVTFCFGNDSGIQGAIDDYWSGSLLLSPSKLFAHQKLLKQRLYSQQS